MMNVKNLVLAVVAMLLLISVARADVVMTYAEAPTDQTSDVAGAITQNFNSLSVGIHDDFTWTNGDTTIGTYDKLSILEHNQYGGAGGTGVYPVTSDNSSLGNVPVTTFKLANPSTSAYTQYFGLWWSAGDKANVLEFFNEGTLVAYFTTANLMDHLNDISGQPYRGNPNNRSQDSGENFAYINFYATAGTSWDTIVFANNASSGFENDNHAVANWSAGGTMLGTPIEDVSGTTIVTTYDLSGTSTSNQTLPAGGIVQPATTVPEPTIIGGLLVTLAAGGLLASKRKTLNF